MREACTNLIYELCKQDSKVIAITADSKNSVYNKIKREMPDQYIDYGIAEQNMIASTAGLASCGKIPFIFATSNFIAMRGYEFIRNDLCIGNKNVKMIGIFCGLARGKWGPTHQGTEENSILRGLPNLKVITPMSPIEAREATRFAYNYDGPVYIRLEASGEKEYLKNSYSYFTGKINILMEGSDVLIISMGSIVSEALKIANSYKGLNIGVISVSDLSNEMKNEIQNEARKYRGVITLEEHNICGALGSSIAEALMENSINVKFRMIGISGCPSGCGEREFLRELNGIGESKLLDTIKEMFN